MLTELQKNQLLQELSFSASRSSGPGGQHVNKVNTKIELRFNINESKILDEKQKNIILLKLANRLTNDSELIITVQTSRSQLKNKMEAIQKFFLLIEDVLVPEKPRQATKPTLGSRKKRLENKKRLSIKKDLRKKPE